MKKFKFVSILSVFCILFTCLFSLVACNNDKNAPKVIRRYGNYSTEGNEMLFYDNGSFKLKTKTYDGYIVTEEEIVGPYVFESEKEFTFSINKATIKRYIGKQLIQEEVKHADYEQTLVYTDDAVYRFDYLYPYPTIIISSKDNLGHELIIEKLSQNVYLQNEMPENVIYYRFFADCTYETIPVNNIDTSKIGKFYLNNNEDLEYYVTDKNHLIDEYTDVYKREIHGKVTSTYTTDLHYYQGEKDPSIYLYCEALGDLTPTEITGFSTDKTGKFEMTVKYNNITRKIPYEVYEKGSPIKIFDYDDFIDEVHHNINTDEYSMSCDCRVLVNGDDKIIRLQDSKDSLELNKNYRERVGITSQNLVYKNSKGEVEYPVLLFDYDDDHVFLNQKSIYTYFDEHDFKIDIANRKFRINTPFDLQIMDMQGNEQTITISQDNVLNYTIQRDELISVNLKIHHDVVDMDYYFKMSIYLHH